MLKQLIFNAYPYIVLTPFINVWSVPELPPGNNVAVWMPWKMFGIIMASFYNVTIVPGISYIFDLQQRRKASTQAPPGKI